jgi:hypothetical protein
MRSRSRSSIQPPVRERRATTDKIIHECSSAHVEQPIIEGSSGYQESSLTFSLDNGVQNNPGMTNGTGLLDSLVHMNVGYLEHCLLPFVSGYDQLRAILDNRSYRLNIRDGHVSSRATEGFQYANWVRL